jgi:ribonucrease Y
MRDVPLTYLIDVVILAAAAGTVLYWIASRKRIAADTVGRAQEQAAQLRRDAERDAESIRKTARLEGKEQAHELLVDADRQARQRRQEIVQLEQALAD